MTRETRQPDLSDMEPPLPELSRLRELSQLDPPSGEVVRAVYGRLQNTVDSAPSVNRREMRPRSWAVALGMVVAVPSAFAATPIGSAWVRQTVNWATHTFVILDTTSANKEEQRPTTSAYPQNGQARVAPIGPRVPIQASSNDDANADQPPVAVFEEVHTLARIAATGVQSQAVQTSTAQQVPSTRQLPNVGSQAVREVVERRAINQRIDTGTLNPERQLLEQARVRLRAGDARGALAFTSQHASKFPNGILEEERLAIINQARALDGLGTQNRNE